MVSPTLCATRSRHATATGWLISSAPAGVRCVLALALGLAACSSDENAPQDPGARGGAAGMGAAGRAPTAGTTASGAGPSGGQSGGGSTGGQSGSGGASGSGGGMGGIGGVDSAAGSGPAGGKAGGFSGGGTSGSDGGMGAFGGVNPGAGTGPEGGNGGGVSGSGGGPGGASGGDGMGGAGGASAYEPCPTDGSPCKILPFGDSITRGAKSSDDAGYRSRLFELIVAAQQKATFTGSATNGPAQVSGQSFPRMHEGHAGWTIDPGYNPNSSYGGISSLVPSPALNGAPHIILLMIGTNDVFARDTANMSTRLEVLIDKVAQNAPNALIVLAKITPLDTSNAALTTALTTYNDRIPGIVQTHAAKGQHIIGVDMSQLPVPADLSDGTHPNDRGYAYMANIWYAAIKDLLPR